MSKPTKVKIELMSKEMLLLEYDIILNEMNCEYYTGKSTQEKEFLYNNLKNEILNRLTKTERYYGNYRDNNYNQIGLRILIHAAHYLYFMHGQEKAAINPDIITFFDWKAEVLTSSIQILVESMRKISNEVG